MQLTPRGELAFVAATVSHGGATITVPDFLIDTGAASTILDADIAAEAGILARHADRLRVLRGVGGREYVFIRPIDQLVVGDRGIDDFELELGDMDYG